MGVYISHIWGEETPLRIEPNFFLVKDIHDVIKHAKFGDARLRGSGVVAGQILAFPIDFAGRPYNTLTLPCERVIVWLRIDDGRESLVRCMTVSLASCLGVLFTVIYACVVCDVMRVYYVHVFNVIYVS